MKSQIAVEQAIEASRDCRLPHGIHRRLQRCEIRLRRSCEPRC